MLKKEVVEMVKKGRFHIYAIKTVDEGLELLSNLEAGMIGKDGTFKEETFNHKVFQKLKKFNELLKSENNDRFGADLRKVD